MFVKFLVTENLYLDKSIDRIKLDIQLKVRLTNLSMNFLFKIVLDQIKSIKITQFTKYQGLDILINYCEIYAQIISLYPPSLNYYF